MPRIALTLLLFLPLALPGTSPYFDWSPKARDAYEKTIQLRFLEAENLLEQLRREEPDNLIRIHIENYLDFFRVFINEDAQEFRRLEKNKDLRLQQLKAGPANSPWKLYLQADIRLQWAFARLKFEEYATAFLEVNKAFKLLEENVKLFPDFMPNKKDLGILHGMAGTIPDGYKWAVKRLSSVQGSIAQGRAELEEVIAHARDNDFIFEEETYVFYSYLLLHLADDEAGAWEFIQKSRLKPQSSPMACFVLANVAMRTGRNDEAIDLLQYRPSGRAFHPFPYLDFMLGAAKLHRLDADAGVYLQKYLDNFSGRNFIKEAHQKLAWHKLIQGDAAGYRAQMGLVKKNGFTVVEGDKSALNEALRNETPQPALLRARLLFDGGYYERASQTLADIAPGALTGLKDEIEFKYRSGRVYQALGNPALALDFYQQTLQSGAAQPWYFACRAALETGRIYEQQGKKERAREAYQKCLTIKPAEHRAGLHQAAKAGLNRVAK
jgi:hypothetical protein